MLNPSLNRRAASKTIFVLVILAALALTLPIAAMQTSKEAQPVESSAGIVKVTGNSTVTADSFTLHTDELTLDPYKSDSSRL